MILITGMCLLAVAVPSLTAIRAVCCYPRLWLLSLGVVATAAVIVLFTMILVTLHRAFSFDPSADNVDLFAVLVLVVGPFGLLHLGLFLILLGSVLDAAKWAAAARREEIESRRDKWSSAA